jgi:hypothetical protein
MKDRTFLLIILLIILLIPVSFALGLFLGRTMAFDEGREQAKYVEGLKAWAAALHEEETTDKKLYEARHDEYIACQNLIDAARRLGSPPCAEGVSRGATDGSGAVYEICRGGQWQRCPERGCV